MCDSLLSSGPAHSSPRSPLRSATWMWAGCGVLLVLLSLAGMGCSSTECKQDSDCQTSQTCQNGKCMAGSQESPGPEAKTEKTSDGGSDGDDGGGTPEPPPFGDNSWTEGQLSPPETLQESQPLPTQGTRKAGETCNPLATALPEDRCSPGSVCAPTSQGITGICLKSCDPQNAGSCEAGTLCQSIVSPDFRKEIGHACAPTVGTGYPCSQAQACAKDNVCMTYSSEHSGICRKVCQGQGDCPKEWCYSRASVQGKDVTGCAPYVTTADQPCPSQTVCGEGLNCYGSSGSRRCLTNCSGGKACPGTHECREIKDALGKVVYSLCFRKVKAGEFCDSTTQCEKDHRCVTLASSPLLARCMRDCTQDAKVCGNQEVCDAVSSSTKVCYQEAKEGQRCGGELRCAKDLVCATTQPDGPQHCMKECKADGDCGTGQKCLALQVGANPPSLCVATCDPKAAQPCAQTGYQCVEKLSTAPVCVPDITSWQGKQDAGATCQPHPVSPDTMRCKPSLRCVSLVEGWHCLQRCDPQAAACPQGQSCLWDHQTQAHYCGTSAGEGKPCDLSQSILCEKGLRCRHQVTSSQGTCVPYNTQAQGAHCSEDTLPCADADLCSGDPILPFRWTCRPRCSTTGTPACPAEHTCLDTVGGSGACFQTCPANNSCSNKIEQCTDIQQKKVCM